VRLLMPRPQQQLLLRRQMQQCVRQNVLLERGRHFSVLIVAALQIHAATVRCFLDQ